MNNNYNHVHVTIPKDEPTRDPLGIVVAAIFLAIGVASIVAAIIVGGWGWLLLILAAPALLFGAAGMALDAVKRPRDANGNAK